MRAETKCGVLRLPRHLGQSHDESFLQRRVLTSSVAAMLVAQFRGYMGLHPTLYREYARCCVVGTEGNLMATQALNLDGQTCVGSVGFIKGQSLGWDFRENQDVSTTLCALFKVFLEINDDLNNKSSDRHLGICQLSLSKILASMLLQPVSQPCAYCLRREAGSVWHSARASTLSSLISIVIASSFCRAKLS
jgi:hypothetical protein